MKKYFIVLASLLSIVSFAMGASPKYRVIITNFWRISNKCFIFEVDIISDNGTPSDVSDDYSMGTGYVKGCLNQINDDVDNTNEINGDTLLLKEGNPESISIGVSLEGAQKIEKVKDNSSIGEGVSLEELKELKDLNQISNKPLTVVDITVSPNPANDELTIDFNGNEFDNLTLQPVDGRISSANEISPFYQKKSYKGQLKVDISKLKPGMYIIIAFSEKEAKVATVKFVKK